MSSDTPIEDLPVLDNLHTIDIGVGETGVTVRLGDKWFNRLNGYDGEIALQETLEGVSTIVGRGVVLDVYRCAFRDIPARFVENEHEEASRSYSGLVSSMQRAYGESFSPDSEVTVFQYERVA